MGHLSYFLWGGIALSPVFLVSSFLPQSSTAYYRRAIFSTDDGSSESYSFDEWYSDFDPAEFDDPSVDNDRFVPGNSDRGGRGAGRRGHDYRRDFGADKSNCDMDAIDELITERLQARKTGQFDIADSIRDTLLSEHGVRVDDKKRMWRTGCSSSGSGSRWGSSSSSFDRQGGRGSRRERDFGPNGHDYNLSPEAGPNQSSLSEEEIHTLLATRLRHKMNREFRDADNIQEELFAAGVSVHDARKEWRADGQGFGAFSDDGRPGRERGSRNDRNRPYEQSPNSQQTDAAEIIQSLVDQRSQAKRARNFQLADDLREELKLDFDVEVNDRMRQWSVGGDFGAPPPSTVSNYRAASPEAAALENYSEIEALVEERRQARMSRDFKRADDIRESLKLQNIFIDDRLNSWRIGEQDAPVSDMVLDSFTRRGSTGDLTEDQIATVEKLLEERSECQRNRKFGRADKLRAKLNTEFNIRVDDRNREWHVVTAEYNEAPGSGSLDDSTREVIVGLVQKRALAKLAKNYDEADAIRDELTDTYAVQLDDRLKEWSVVGGQEMLNEAEEDDDDDGDWSTVDMELEDEDYENDDDDEGEEGEKTSEIDLQSLTVPELKEKLREAGLPVSGRKAELIERLESN